MRTPYPEVSSSPNFPEIEQKIIAKWKLDHTFEQSLKGDSEFVFYDGPPFANGLPHYGHLLTGFIKDAFPRYQTMLGKKVGRRFGWDCHGLPAEMATEKELGVSGRVAIESYGIDKFNAHCQESVLKYTKEWQDYVHRQARWVDFENDYKTMDITFMESVLWAFKALYDKGLIYNSMRVLPYSWACQTPVSDFETKMDNSYREKASKAVTVAFTLTNDSFSAFTQHHLLDYDIDTIKIQAWTTTPWTLPSNLALAVGADIEYSLYQEGSIGYIIASKFLPTNAVAILSIKGHELAELTYTPLFPYFKDHPDSFRVLCGDFVTIEDGTGVVHIAPGFGEDDHALCQQHNIDLVCPVDEAGQFTYPVSDFIGIQVFDTNDDIIKHLKEIGAWINTSQYLHNYPHCWRTDTPLIYKAMPSWYVKVTAIKDKMIANNQQINWIPGHIKNGLFGKWLETTRDWSISRNRFWGCPIPIWQSDDPQYPHMEVYGSIKEIEAAFGVKVENLHRPFIDSLTKPNPKDPTGKSVLRRVTDVLDCWFESGSMPFAQVHYPFENKEWFESHFPADFIVEYVAQTRGWFYTMVVLATALFDQPPFLNCICHGVILGDGGQKLSKRLKNYADPNDVFNQLGADAMRWYMLSSPIMRGQEMVIEKDARSIREVLRLAIKPIWNAYNFFTLYANADNITAQYDLSSNNLLDRYIISNCINMTLQIKTAMDNYDSPNATKAAEHFIDVLNNWYIRRCRDRFWKKEHDADKYSAYNTLYSVLHILCRAVAPLMPLIAEEIFLGITNNRESVHLQPFPTADDYPVDFTLLSQMERVRDACTAAFYLRNESGIRTRQPLASATFIGVGEQSLSTEMSALVMDEINVKHWYNLGKDDIAKYANYRLQINFPIVGKRLPTRVKDIITANKENQWELDGISIKIAGEILNSDEFSLKLEPKPEFKDKIAALSTNDGLVLLDLELSSDLLLEGMARDVVRAVQQMRKTHDFTITDNITISMHTNSSELHTAVETWQDYIKAQTLCISISWPAEYDALEAVSIEGHDLKLKIDKA